MATAVKADVVLQQLSSDFEKSKTEQIFRFLRDQEELNHEESHSIITSDFSNDSDDVSDTETLLNQRLDLHRVRPQSAKGWQLDSPPSDDPTPDFVCVGKNITSGEDFSRSIQRESKLRESVLYKSNRERSLPRKPVSANINPKDSMGETMPDIFNRS
ncbi:hypothetical protein CAPTEDRAFT_191112 [Capitella teleta]|uniref:Uncharacterized protein n=1 Tax=Capitella teleta TaxID=283909 RepID=R7UYX2_CAPTE|nr:hypothetical protein CAPTEDRAFT_191112 [Capitella teleta]|eukprot:ELU08596.1 hypothetical protein CAPTEDRAFT_191112 [Capitella teleta]